MQSRIDRFFTAGPSRAEPEESDSDSDSFAEDVARDRSPLKKAATTKKAGRVRRFCADWLAKFPWLRFDETENHMHCNDCRRKGVEGSWATGNSNFRLKTLTVHASSEAHKLSIAGSDTRQLALTRQIQMEDANRKAAIVTALKAVYWLACEEMPNVKYASLLGFLQSLGVKDALFLNKGNNAKYTSPQIFNELLSSLSRVVEKKMKMSASNSPFIGIGIDESTDRSQEKHIAVIIRFVEKDGTVKTSFLKLEAVEDGRAFTTYQALERVLDSYSIKWTKIVGLGADGAAVMSGERAGVKRLVQEENPHCTYVHCVCHRLNLAVSQACGSIPEMETLGKILSGIYTFIHQSPKKQQKFKDMAALLEADVVKFKRIFDIRWLSMGESVNAVIRNYETLTAFLSQEADAGEPVTIGLLQQLSSYLYLATLHLAADIFSATNHLSKLFQYRDVSFGALGQTLTDCQDTLLSLRDNDGPFLAQMRAEYQTGTDEQQPDRFKGQEIKTGPIHRRQHVDQRERFVTLRREVIGTILENIATRFPHVALLDSMQIFDPGAFPATAEEMTAWGNVHLNTLLDHYGSPKHNQTGVRFNRLVDPDVARGEFLPFKRLAFRNRGEDKPGADGQQHFHFFRPTEHFERLFDGRDRFGNREIFPELFKLMSACMCVLVGNAEAERVFSSQNKIKSKLRTKLTVGHLDQLVRLSYGKVSATEFPFEESMEFFF